MQKLGYTTMVGLALVAGLVIGSGLTMQAGADDVKIESGWRYSDGNWNYWDADDNSWYYTDGKHWYSYGDDSWKIYNFDRKFARKAYRKGYVVPGDGVDIVVPRHRVKVKIDD